MAKENSSNLRAALVLLILLVIYTLAINFGGYQLKFVWVSYTIVVVGIMISVIKYGDSMKNNVSFGNLFAYGFKTTATLIIFYIGFSVLFYLIFPAFKLHLEDIMRGNDLKNISPETTGDEGNGMVNIKRFFWTSMLAGIVISCGILGAAGSLIGAAITKKRSKNIVKDINQIGQ